MNLKTTKAMTLVEGLVSILLLGAFITSFLGAFFISQLSTLRVQHRMTAMNILNSFLEREIKAGMDGGNADSETDENDKADYYVTVKSSDPITITPVETITVNGQTYTLMPDPYYPFNVYENYEEDRLLTYENRNYAIKGFTVSWTEKRPGGGNGSTYTERAVVYLFDHAAT